MPARVRRSPYSRPARASVVPGARDMRESVLQGKVAAYARQRGALHYHTHRSEKSEEGFPDSVIVGNWVMFRELKSDSDSATVSKAQRDWIERLRAAGADVDVWWPIDWERGRIQNEINACTRQRSTDGELTLPDIAKTLFLFSDARPAAGLLWDAGARGIDRITWQGHARSFMRLIAGALPSTTEEVLAWIRRHRIGPNDGAAAIIEALRSDLASAEGDGDLD